MSSMVVNTNVKNLMSINSMRKSNRSGVQSLERLASGYRINHSADDPAGMAIATGMTATLRGLSRALRNADDALMAINTASGAIETQTEILQRIRELAIKSGSDILSQTQLEGIQAEIDEQIQELERIGDTSNFNGKNLIDGTFTDVKIQVGARAEQTISVSIGDFRASQMGAIAKEAGASTDLSLDSAVTSDVKINGVALPETSADGVSEPALSKHSAIAKAKAINAITPQTGVTASVGETLLTSGVITGGAAAFAAPGTDSFGINGVTIVDTTETLAMTNDGSALIAKINTFANQTGVTAMAGAVADTIELRAADGRNIVVDQTGATLAETGFDAVQGSAALSDATTNQATAAITLSSSHAIAIEALDIDQIGFADATTISVDAERRVSSIDVTQAGGIEEAIQITDAALETIANAQVEVGSKARRLEHTLKSLSVAVENLAASGSRIRDTDFALGMATLTQSQIIRQTGTAILAQANISPSAVLSLLQ